MNDERPQSVQERAIRLLSLIRDKTELSGTPIFVSELEKELGAGQSETQAAFRYLADHRWVDTFSIPYTGRINARGQDVIAEIERHLAPARTRNTQADTLPAHHEWDVFISHAHEDKEAFVRPLAKRLQEAGLRVWFDEFTLTVGDSLRQSIDRGLAHSRFGIVVISPFFLQKDWPQKELDGLVAREVGGVKLILPVWHNLGVAELRAKSPLLADRVATSSTQGMDHVVQELLRAVRVGDTANSSRPAPAVIARNNQSEPPREERARLDVLTARWEPAGLRLKLRYRPEYSHVGISARVTVQSPTNATLKEGRAVHNPARMVSGGHTRYEPGGSFVENVGVLRLRPLDDARRLELGAVFFIAPSPDTADPVLMARVRIEIITDDERTLLAEELAVSPLD